VTAAKRAGRAIRAALLAAVLAGAAGAQEQSAESLSPIAQAAAQRGIATCLPAIDRLAKELAATHDIGVFLFNQLDQPDAGLASISMELTPSPSDGPLYLSASFVSTPAGGCQVMVEATIYWASNCTAVGLAYPGYTVTGHLLGEIRILAAQGAERLFLMPALGNGCISIEKSVYF
jgi:hypothetical protein